MIRRYHHFAPRATNHCCQSLNLKKDRDYFFKKAKISGDEGDWFIARTLRNRTNIAMRTTKADYIKKQLQENEENQKKSWNLISTEILPDKNKTTFNFLNVKNCV